MGPPPTRWGPGQRAREPRRRREPRPGALAARWPIEIAGPRAFLLDTRASVYLALNQPAKALRDLTVAIGEDPTPDKFFHLARVHLAMADLKKAEDAFQLATKAKLHIGRLSPLEAPEYRAVADAIYRKN